MDRTEIDCNLKDLLAKVESIIPLCLEKIAKNRESLFVFPLSIVPDIFLFACLVISCKGVVLWHCEKRAHYVIQSNDVIIIAKGN